MKYYVTKFPLMYNKETLYKLDDRGVLLTKIPYTQDYNYSLESITSYALTNMEDFMNIDSREKFLNQVNWMVENINENGIWEQNFKLPYYKFNLPWVDGMGQGLAISSLIRAYQVTAKQEYLRAAKIAFSPFEKQIKTGGNLFVDKKRRIWIEECPVDPAPHILSGFIYALFGVYDLYSIKLHKSAGELWFNCIDTLERNLDKYDLGFWSRHNLIDEHPSEFGYHDIHIEQLRALYKLTEKQVFKKYADKWTEYQNSSFCRQKANIKRGIAHFRRHGTVGLARKYIEKKRWLND